MDKGMRRVTITLKLRYTGEGGNLRYEYYPSQDDPETVLLIDRRRDQAAIDAHHTSPMTAIITALWKNTIST